EKHGKREPAQQVGNRLPFPLQGAKKFGEPVGTGAVGVARRVGILELRVFIYPVEPERLGSVLLMNQCDRLAVDDPVVALDDKVRADAPADEFRTVMREPELHGERVPIMLTCQPVWASRQPRLKNMSGMSPAPRQVPKAFESGQ